MGVAVPTRSVRLGDPLRRAFLDELRRRVLLPRQLAGEWTMAKADLAVGLVDLGGPLLVLSAGTLDEDERRWTLRQSLDDFDGGDLVDRRAAELVGAGHEPLDARRLAGEDTAALVEAIVAALERVAELRPEQASVPRGLAAAIRHALHGNVDLAGAERSPAVDDRAETDEEDQDYEEDQDDAEDAEPARERISSSVSVTRPTPRRRRGGAARTLLWVVILGALATAVAVGTRDDARRDPSSASATERTAPTAAAAVLSDHVIAGRNRDGSPVRFDPCRSYEFVVNPGTLAPEEAIAEVGAAFAALEGGTGVAFRFAGVSSNRFPHPIDPANPPGLPMVVSYERQVDSPALREGASTHHDGAPPLGGLAVGTPRQVRPDLTVLVGGALVIDETLTAEQRARILLHELGHLAGLGHAADPDQIMAPTVPETGPIAYRAGDLAGLAAVGGASGCALTDAERATVFA